MKLWPIKYDKFIAEKKFLKKLIKLNQYLDL
jgi:hypothetical protein